MFGISYSRIAAAAPPQLARGRVWCRACGASHQVNAAECLRNGWPRCCDATMTIDSPEEQEVLRAE